MAMLRGAWLGCAAIGVALLAAAGCKGESTVGDDDGDDVSACGRLRIKLNDCDMGALVDDADECEEPTEVESRCTYKCIINAGCDELRQLVCSSSLSPGLETCVIACMPPPFTCGDGTTVSEFGLCDGFPDCSDGTDETTGCPHCENGQTYPTFAECDGFPDCADGTDESRCPMFECASGEAIPESYECDYYDDCTDGSDEHARCPGFRCASGDRVPESYECDGETDCLDGSDEHARCPTIPCADGTVVVGERCNDVYECPDYSDEPANCPPSAEERICEGS